MISQSEKKNIPNEFHGNPKQRIRINWISDSQPHKTNYPRVGGKTFIRKLPLIILLILSCLLISSCKPLPEETLPKKESSVSGKQELPREPKETECQDRPYASKCVKDSAV